jgi:hypothetical protein
MTSWAAGGALLCPVAPGKSTVECGRRERCACEAAKDRPDRLGGLADELFDGLALGVSAAEGDRLGRVIEVVGLQTPRSG